MNIRSIVPSVSPEKAARLEELDRLLKESEVIVKLAKAAVEEAEQDILPDVSRWILQNTATDQEKQNPGCVRLGEAGTSLLRAHHGWGHPDRTVALLLPHTPNQDIVEVVFETLMTDRGYDFHWYSETYKYSRSAGVFVLRQPVPLLAETFPPKSVRPGAITEEESKP